MYIYIYIYIFLFVCIRRLESVLTEAFTKLEVQVGNVRSAL